MSDTADSEAEADAEAHRRRTVIRLLVGLGIGIPVLIELATLVGLVEQSLLGDDSGSEGAGTAASTATETDRGVAVGDELLPATTPRETLSVASYRAGDSRWVLTLAATVENTTAEPYTILFEAVTTEDGQRVEGRNRAVTVAAGETAQVTGTWQLPTGSRPESVGVRTGAGDTATTDHQVELSRIAVEGN